MKKIISMMLILTMTFSLVACGNIADGEDENEESKVVEYTLPEANVISTMNMNEEEINTFSDFSVELFKRCNKDQNIMISPMSILYAMSMTANGADGKTEEEMLDVLAGGMDMNSLNAYLKTYMNNLKDDEYETVKLANSIWYNSNNENVLVKPEFLQTVSDYYDAEIYSAGFNDETVNAINDWISDKTENKITAALDKVSPDAFMYLINTILFDAEWDESFQDFQLEDGVFNAISGEKQDVTLMNGEENNYFENDEAIGFKKYYQGKYAFVAMLPKDENEDIDEFIANLSGEKLVDFMKPVENSEAIIKMPKFEYDYDIELSEVLKNMGIEIAFDNSADFSNMVDSTDSVGISRVIHKTHIENSETGTIAAAVTIVEMGVTSVAFDNTKKMEVFLDRPFVYVIIDTDTNLPLFIGSVKSIE